MKKLFLSLLIFCCASCAAQNNNIWVYTNSIDEFSDNKRELVIAPDYATSKSYVTKMINTYPIITKVGEQIYVGVQSGGRYKLPVGTIQMRIDDHPAWTITPQEIPDFMPVESPPIHQFENKTTQEAYEQAMSVASKFILPYTVVGGDDAKKILLQMLDGNVLIYRKIDMHQQTSTTGRILLDDSLENSLLKLGITRKNLER